MQQQFDSSLVGQRQGRLDKVKKIREIGIDPYPAKSDRTHTVIEILNDFEALSGAVCDGHWESDVTKRSWAVGFLGCGRCKWEYSALPQE